MGNHSQQQSNTVYDHDEVDINLVEMWLRKDPVRWISGIVAGVFAMSLAMVVAGVLSASTMGDALYPIKVGAIPLLGAASTEYAVNIMVLAVGAAWMAAIGAVLGLVFAHFVATNSFLPLLGMGFTWAMFSWIFICNLFMPAFKEIKALQLDHGATLLICLVFGFSLVSVSAIDRVFRGR